MVLLQIPQGEVSKFPSFFKSNIMDQHEKYLKNQALWLKITGLKIGDKVLIARKVESHTNGWDNSWADEMDNQINIVGRIYYIDEDDSSGIIVDIPNEADFSYPYMSLSKV